MTNKFNESLFILDQQQKDSMRNRPCETQRSARLAPLPATARGNQTNRITFAGRPMSAATINSASSTGL